MSDNQYKMPVLNSFERTLSSAVRIQLYVVILSIVGFIIGFLLYQRAIVHSIDRIYVVKDLGIDRVVDKKVMIKGHVGNFYKLFFQGDQFTYKGNINQALNLIGNSGKDLYMSFKNKDYYAKLVSLNLNVTTDIDSIKIYGESFPYQVQVFAKRRMYNAYGSILTRLDAQMLVYPSTSTEKNPYGLMIDKFLLINEGEIKEAIE